MTQPIKHSRQILEVIDSDLTGSTFTNTNLQSVRFNDVNLRDVAFHDVDLSRAAFFDVKLSHASIENANLEGLRINGLLITDVIAGAERRTNHRNPPGAVIVARNPSKLARFYAAVACLSVIQSDDQQVVLSSDHLQLVIHGLPENVAREIELTDPPTLRQGAAMQLCFPVSSIAAARAKAPDLGGALRPVAQEWEGDGFRACNGNDPEGNVIQFWEAV